MNRISRISVAIASIIVLGACGRGEVVVQATLEGETAGEGAPEARTLNNLPVRLLPYDRDMVFDSLEAAHSVPEPAIPDSLLQLQERIAEAQALYQQAEQSWGTLRDSLAGLGERLEGMNPSSADYRLMYSDFDALEPEVNALEQERDQLFGDFEALQAQLGNQSAELRIAIEEWENDAFAELDLVIRQKLEETGQEELMDVTGPDGSVRFQVPPGEWWVYARHSLPYRDLYWNLPITVTSGEPATLELTSNNATVRPQL